MKLKNLFLVIALAFLFNISFISSEEFGYNLLEPKIEFNITVNGTLNHSNSTDYWITTEGALGTVNGTQFENNGGVLSIIPSWIIGLIGDAYCALTGCTMSGDINMSGNNLEAVGHIQFDPAGDGCVDEFCLEVNTDDGTLDLSMPGGDVTLQIGEEMLIRAKNDEGVQINNGQLVRISSGLGSVPLIKLADKSAIWSAGVIGIATEDILDGQLGFVTTEGLVRDVNTSGLGVGSVLYLGDDGNYTTTITEAPDIKVIVGIVIRDHATEGVIYSTTTLVPRLSGLSDVYGNPDANYHIQWDNSSSRFIFTDNVTFNSATFDGIILKALDEKNDNIAGPAFGVYMTGPSGQNLPHWILQSGGSSQASVLLRSQMIVNEIAGFHNTTNATDCIAYMNYVGEILKIDCNTTTTGADLIVGDDMQVVGDVWLKDTDGEWHFMTRELELLDELRDETLISRINSTLVNNVFTIIESHNKSLVVNINETNYFIDTTDNITLTNGTNATPIFNHVYYTDGGTATLTKSTTPIDDVADVGQFLLGNGGIDYGSIVSGATSYEFIRNVYHSEFENGAKYISGFNINASSTDFNFTTGIMKIILNRYSIDSNHSSNLGYTHIHNDGEFHQHINLNGLDEYGSGEVIGNNKYFNVVCGITHTQDGNGRLYCVVQNKPTVEYTKLVDAEVDSTNTIQFFPNNDFISKVYIPVARFVIKNTGGTMTIQALTNGDMWYDVRGTVTASAGSNPSPGITSHPDLSNLGYDASGHTGFAADSGDNLTGEYNFDGAVNINDTLTFPVSGDTTGTKKIVFDDGTYNTYELIDTGTAYIGKDAENIWGTRDDYVFVSVKSELSNTKNNGFALFAGNSNFDTYSILEASLSDNPSNIDSLSLERSNPNADEVIAFRLDEPADERTYITIASNGTERTLLNPSLFSGINPNYLFDTIATVTHNLLSIRNFGDEVFVVQADGNTTSDTDFCIAGGNCLSNAGSGSGGSKTTITGANLTSYDGRRDRYFNTVTEPTSVIKDGVESIENIDYEFNTTAIIFKNPTWNESTIIIRT